MARNQDGEFEVLLGNKQLLSIFFIVVILLGVFFTMGYILGKNSAAPGKPSTIAAKPPAESSGAPASTTSAFSQDQSKDDVRPLVENATAPAPAPAKTQPAVPAATQAQAPEPPKKAVASKIDSEPLSGKTYLQVAAVKRPMAELVAEVLQKKGFHCILVQHPTEPVYRVLVGPAADADAVTKLRQDLEKAGFKAIARKF